MMGIIYALSAVEHLFWTNSYDSKVKLTNAGSDGCTASLRQHKDVYKSLVNIIWNQTAYCCKQEYQNIKIGLFAEPTNLNVNKYSNQFLAAFLPEMMELLDKESESHRLLPDDVEGETNIGRPIENWLEGGFDILFEENQSSTEVSGRRTMSKKTKAGVNKGRDSSVTDECEDEQSKSKKKRKKPKKIPEMPDHFIALQISNPKIQKSFADVQDKIVSKSPPLIHAMVSTKKLHITVMPVCLPTQEHIEKATSALRSCATRLSKDFGSRLFVLGVAGIGNFRNNVLFARVAPSDPSLHNALQNISDVVNDTFVEHGIRNTDKKSDFKPHVTIAKLSKNFRKLRQQGIKKIEPSLYVEDVDRHFGHQVITSLQLCSMFKKDTATGYYKILHEASFGPQNISNLTIENQSGITSAADVLVQWIVKSAMDSSSHLSGEKFHRESGEKTHKESGEKTQKESGEKTHKESGEKTHKKLGEKTHKESGVENKESEEEKNKELEEINGSHMDHFATSELSNVDQLKEYSATGYMSDHEEKNSCKNLESDEMKNLNLVKYSDQGLHDKTIDSGINNASDIDKVGLSPNKVEGTVSTIDSDEGCTHSSDRNGCPNEDT